MRRILITVVVSLGCLIAIREGLTPLAQAEDYRGANDNAVAPLTSVLYRFDPVSQAFFTVPLPLGSMPQGLAITGTNPTQVWVAESGSNRIGRVVFTSTVDYQVYEYPVTSTASSQPFRITVHGDYVWFTERGANRVGRLNTLNGLIDEFDSHGLSLNAGLSDIKAAPDGQVWLGEEEAKRLVRLVITSTQDYSFDEFTDTLRPGFVVAPYALAVENNDSIWMTAPHVSTPTMRLAQFTPSTRSFEWPTILANSRPYDVVALPGRIWFSDRQRNELTQIELGTFPILNPYGPISRPNSLAAESSSVFWGVLDTIPGALGRLENAGTPLTTVVTSFAFPDIRLNASAVAVAADGGIWVAGYQTYQQFMPMIMRSYDGYVPSIGAQTYWPITSGYGLTRMVESQMTWVRYPIAWAGIEPVNTTPDHYNWASTDASLRAAKTSNLNLIGTISSNPAWATSSGTVEPAGLVADLSELQEFVGALVARYPYVKYWEFYNEPDKRGWFGLQGTAYADMLKAVYPVVKSANPDAQVVMGGIALDWFIDQGGPFDRNFLPDVLNSCRGHACFDIANFHYYPAFRYVWEPYGRDIIGKANYVRQILATYEYTRPVINTETGWPNISSWGGTELAARWVPKVFVRGMAANLSTVIWYALLDSDTSDPGLLDPQLVPRPSYEALRTLTSLVNTARFVRSIPAAETGSSFIEGYQFSITSINAIKRLDVYWYDCPSMAAYPVPYDCDNVAPLKISASRLGKIDKFGNRVIVDDINDGYQDGFVTLDITSSPVYVDYQP